VKVVPLQPLIRTVRQMPRASVGITGNGGQGDRGDP
jgi:hypothetical protein